MSTTKLNKNEKGFTLIELLVVIGILAILLAITLIAINPAARFGQANDTKRRSDITQILNAIGQYTASNGGNLPTQLQAASSSATPIDQANFPAGATGLCEQLIPAFAPALPMDPSLDDSQAGIADCTEADWETGYSISRDSNGRITVSAPSAYDDTNPIEVTR